MRMNGEWKRHLMVILSGALLGGALLGCDGADEEQGPVSVVSEGVGLLESSKVGGALKLTTKDFVAFPGRLDRKAVSRRMVSFFRTHGEIDIVYPTPEVEVVEDGNAALVTTPFVVAKKGVSTESLDQLSDDPEAWEKEASRFTTVEHAEISLVKQNDLWRVQSIRF